MQPTRRFRRLGAAFAIAIVMLGVSAAAAAQRGFFRSRQREIDIRNAPYNGQFTFVRVNYTTAPGGYWYQGLPAWSHGFPLAERNLMRILNEITDLGPRIDEINSVKLDDPELFKYPVAYIIEVGWWEMTDREAVTLRAYLAKGGFVIVDDFKMPGGIGGGGWEQFAESRLGRLDPFSREGRVVSRHLYGGATEAELDGQGRVMIPQPLLRHGGLSKEIVVAGLRDFLEIWDLGAWRRQEAESEGSVEDVAERLSQQ